MKIEPEKLTVAKLRTHLAKRGLEYSGTKDTLVQRLKEALESKSKTALAVAKNVSTSSRLSVESHSSTVSSKPMEPRDSGTRDILVKRLKEALGSNSKTALAVAKNLSTSSRLSVESHSSTASSKPTEVAFTARGIVPPVFTPLNDDLSVNYSVIPAYAQWLAKAGIKSILVGGTTGEHMSLSVAVRKKLIDAWVKAGKDSGLHIMVQVAGAPIGDVVDLVKYCASAGVDSLLTLPELYFKPTTVDQLVTYVEIVAKAAPTLPILYYHIPGWSKVEVNMPEFVLAATARIPNFKGIKFTCNDLSEGAQVLRNLEEGQEVFLGADTLLAPAALLGFKSSIGTTYNMFPTLAQEILAAVAASDVTKARALQEKLSIAVDAHTVEGAWIPIMKAGMEIVTGIKMGPPTLPQKPISMEAKKRIQQKLVKLGLAK